MLQDFSDVNLFLNNIDWYCTEVIFDEVDDLSEQFLFLNMSLNRTHEICGF